MKGGPESPADLPGRRAWVGTPLLWPKRVLHRVPIQARLEALPGEARKRGRGGRRAGDSGSVPPETFLFVCFCSVF